MGAPTEQKEMSNELEQRLEVLHQEIATLNQAVEEVLSGRKKHKPTLVFPFSLLDWLIHTGLINLERLVERLVTTIFR